MHHLDTLLSTLQRCRAETLVALGETTVQERDCDAVLPGGGMKADILQPSVDGGHGRILSLIDRLLIGVATDVSAEEFLAVEQRHDRVLELHPRHVASQRHIADG